MMSAVSTLGVVLAALAASHVGAVSFALWSASASAPAEDPYELMDKGYAARDAEQFDKAAQYMSDAYEAMSPKERLGDPGQEAVRVAVEAYRSIAEKDGSKRPLRAARDLLRRYVDALDTRKPSPKPSEEEERLRTALEELEAQNLDSEPEPPPDPRVGIPAEENASDGSPANTQHEGTAPPGRSTDAPKKSRKRGPALIGAGASLLAGGTVVLVQGLRFPSLGAKARQEAEAEIEASNGMLEPADWSAHDETQLRKGKILVGVGAGAAAVGAALTTWGVVWLVKDKKTPLTAAPAVSRTSAGLSVIGRF